MISHDDLLPEPELPEAGESPVALPLDPEPAEASAAVPETAELPLTAALEPEAAATATEPATLAEFVQLSQKGRMSPAAEERAAELLRDELLGGRAEIDAALEFIVVLPWPISVNALNAAWPQMKPYGRRLFVSGMKAGRFEGEMGRRIRLSLTRGLAKVDEPQAAKWACAIAQEMLGVDGTLAIRDRQSFFNVFIGKGKPWLLRLPLTGLKEGDVRAFLTCAVITVFSGGCPPYTQSSLLQWMQSSGKLEALEEKTLLIIAQTIRRWPGRLLRDFSQAKPNCRRSWPKPCSAERGRNKARKRRKRAPRLLPSSLGRVLSRSKIRSRPPKLRKMNRQRKAPTRPMRTKNLATRTTRKTPTEMRMRTTKNPPRMPTSGRMRKMKGGPIAGSSVPCARRMSAPARLRARMLRVAMRLPAQVPSRRISIQ